MNANKLADLLEQGAFPVGTRHQAAIVLRQQADRIVELEKQNDRLLTIAENFKLVIETKVRGSK
jgi:hypothetical protein